MSLSLLTLYGVVTTDVECHGSVGGNAAMYVCVRCRHFGVVNVDIVDVAGLAVVGQGDIYRDDCVVFTVVGAVSSVGILVLAVVSVYVVATTANSHNKNNHNRYDNTSDSNTNVIFTVAHTNINTTRITPPSRPRYPHQRAHTA